MQDRLSSYIKPSKKNKYKRTNYLMKILKAWDV